MLVFNSMVNSLLVIMSYLAYAVLTDYAAISKRNKLFYSLRIGTIPDSFNNVTKQHYHKCYVVYNSRIISQF
ncbi:hypothetical protein C3B55_00167 [Candidatus Pseudomonas adelgestsugas]|uniref:Secreted protein n=1 Tax=Candidatus Pseudomonas adelgestsugas TaxID=1302376 RepID=A0ABX5R7K7_9PSED|nr:hypothetical protein C3B55_00167 [Candidatus Pseudomonas adelgestsugas]